MRFFHLQDVTFKPLFVGVFKITRDPHAHFQVVRHLVGTPSDVLATGDDEGGVAVLINYFLFEDRRGPCSADGDAL